MKKIFEKATMEELDVMQTAGGPINNEAMDQDYYAVKDADGNILHWSRDFGTKEVSE